jgi:hypothetical protein
MEKKTLVYERQRKLISKEILILENTEDMRIVSNPVCWRIMKLLSERPSYPAQIAKELKVYEQSVYYYIRKLLRVGAIEQVETRFVKGGTARMYRPASAAFGMEMEWGEKQTRFGIHAQKRCAQSFFKEYIVNDSFDGLVIVGAPDPHGPYKSSARDGHYAVHLGMFLGTFCNIPSDFIVKLDSDAKAERVYESRNLICIGGPGTNMVSAEFNKFLPIKFDDKNFWSGLVDKAGKRYNSDNQGLIAKINHPYADKKKIIVVAGVRSIGTKSAVIALTNYSEEILNVYQNQDNLAFVVQGFDMNADGKMDFVDLVSWV